MSLSSWFALPSRTISRDQAIALTGVISPLILIDELSQKGMLNPDLFEKAMQPLFVFEPEDVESVFAQQNLQESKEQLLQILRYHPSARNRRLLRYLVTLFKIERQLAKDDQAMQTIRTRLSSIFDYYRGVKLDEAKSVEELASTYTETLSRYPQRVEIQGRSTFLKQDKVAANIRCLLLSSVRALVLWRQVGGSRSHFLTARNALIKEVETFRA